MNTMDQEDRIHWLRGEDLPAMVRQLRSRLAAWRTRKPRLALCAISRITLGLLPEVAKRCVEESERVADSSSKYEVLDEVYQEMKDASSQLAVSTTVSDSFYQAFADARLCAIRNAYMALESAALFPSPTGVQGVAAILHDVFGDPFRPVALDARFRTPQVLSLAQAAYDDRPTVVGRLDPLRLMVLADALEEAGCTDAGILEHLRSPGPHVRGCWALDLVLGKE